MQKVAAYTYDSPFLGVYDCCVLVPLHSPRGRGRLHLTRLLYRVRCVHYIFVHRFINSSFTSVIASSCVPLRLKNYSLFRTTSLIYALKPLKHSGSDSQTSVAEVKHRPLRIVRGWGTEGRLNSTRARVDHLANDH